MKRISVLILASGAMAISHFSFADEPARVGANTNQWLELQRSGNAASETERPMSGEMAARSYERYLDTFDEKIDKSLTEDQQSFVQGK